MRPQGWRARAGRPGALRPVLLATGIAAVIAAGIATGIVTVLMASGAHGPRRAHHPRPHSLAALTPVLGTRSSHTPTATTAPTTAPATLRPPRSLLQIEVAAAHRLAAHGLPLYCGGHRRRMVALTFDDGPGEYTHYAIRKLRAAHLHATFFLVGRQVLGAPALAVGEKRVAMFGDHTMTHPYLPGLKHRQALRQIVAARRLIQRTVHEPVLLFRPPYEAHTPWIDRQLRRLRMVEVLWNVDSGDSLGAGYRQIERRVIAGLRPGSIILMHENHGQTIRALRRIFAALHRRHLRAVTVPQLIAQDPPSLGQLRRGWAGCPVRAVSGNGT